MYYASQTIPGRKPLRLWPGVVIAVLVLVVRFILPAIIPEALGYGFYGGVLGWMAIVVWWLFLSRAHWSERLGSVVLMPLALYATWHMAHVSIATGAQGLLLIVLAPPVLGVAFVGWAVATRHISDGPRRVTMVVTILLACGGWTLVRTGGVFGNFNSDLHWRWAKTPEERLLAQSANLQSANTPALPSPVSEPKKAPEKPAEKELGAKSANQPPAPAAAVAVAPPGSAEPEAEWPGFRGPHREHRSRRADQDRLELVAPGSVMAASDRARVVVVRGSR